MIGLGLSITQLAVRQLVGQFNPMKLFALGEQGAWYDPSDLSTLFQDVTGTTPVTAVEQPVGLMLDKSGRGNHARQTTATSRPVLSARYNLLTKTEQFDDGVWAKSGGAITPNAASAPDGTLTADLFTASSTSGFVRQTITAQVGVTYSQAFVLKRFDNDWVMVYATGVASSLVWFNLATGEFGAASAGVISSSSTALPGGWYEVKITWLAEVGTVYPAIKVVVENATSTGSLASVYIWGASLVPANQADLPYQRVNTATDYDAGPAFPRYLRCDGIDDWMVTGTITPGTDKAQVFAGVRKLSDAVAGVLMELGANITTINGSLLLLNGTSGGSGASWLFASRGTAMAFPQSGGYASPITNVLTGLGDISGDRATLRVDGAQAAETTTDQGTGNYLAYPLYLFRRGGTTLPFNGHFYGGIIRFGDNLPIETIQQTEAYMAAKTGVTLA